MLSLQVPQIAGDEAARLFVESLATAGVKRDRVTGWIFHAGGRDVLAALREKVGLTESDVRHSAAVLREYGNVSSPTVLFVLERALHVPCRTDCGGCRRSARDSVVMGPCWRWENVRRER